MGRKKTKTKKKKLKCNEIEIKVLIGEKKELKENFEINFLFIKKTIYIQ